ncbi:MAG: LytTR family DNA-binding domain-containing protein [Melioribacter sp.]|nr:LytTR family DNA-binding domain-containing protein [Melioribacter sp.]
MKVKTIIIDDEPHAREGLIIRLRNYNVIDVIAECSSGNEAIDKINSLAPDLVFLDIQMPDMSGFEVLKNIKQEKVPFVIFVTAYDKYALKAFEYHAIDYLLKPINEERLKSAINYAINEIKGYRIEHYSEKIKLIANEYLELMKNDEAFLREKKFVNRISVKHKNVIKIISVKDIDWLEAQGDYVCVHTDNEKYLIHDSLKSLEKKLDPEQFVRIHRSAIVNIDKIEIIKSNLQGDYDVFLKNGTKVKMSRNYKKDFQRIMGNMLN